MNTKIKHTPGPWSANWTKFDGKHVGFNVTCRKFGSLHPICETNSKTDQAFTSEEIEANASLIAAAPELLDALCDMVSDRECLSAATLQFARAAIAKATGFDL